MAKHNAVPKPDKSENAGEAIPGERVLGVVRGLAAEAGKGQFDRMIHERLRLAMVSALAVNDSLTFSELKELLGTSDGNLSVHARKLEDAGYITARKYFQGRVPKTEFRLTPTGRQALEQYLDHMESLIRAMRNK